MIEENFNREDPDAHAKLAPSSSARWIACPGSVQAQADVFDPSLDDSNEHSRLGVAAHALLENCLLLGVPPQEFIGKHLAGKDHPAVDEDMCDWVQVALDYIEEYVDTYGEENLTVLPETRVYIGPQINITGNEARDSTLCSGTSDVIIAHNDMSMCVVIDYKNGVRKVEAKENPQTMLYNAGARQIYGKFKKYRSVIVQPRAGKRSPVDEWDFTDSMLRKFLEHTVRPSARAAILPNAPRVAGDHCLWCAASPRCRTRKNKVMAVAGVEFSALEEAPDPELLSPQEFLQVLDSLKFLKDYIGSVEAHALKMVEQDPRSLPGWVLGWSKRMRLWDDETAVIEYCKSIGIKQDDYAPRELLSPAQLTKIVKRRRPTPRRKKGEPEPANPLDAFVKYSIPSPKLMCDSDPAEGEFGELAE